MDKFVRNLITEWRRLGLSFAGKTLVVAVSGGADSSALLHSVADLRKRQKLDFQIVAAHFNHQLRGAESGYDEEFVNKLAKAVEVEFISGRGEIPAKGNLEQNARVLRYEFLTNVAAKLDAYAVLTAHTMNDQAETFLLNLVRGSGIDGLSAMKAERSLTEFSSCLLLRPLLKWAKRGDTEEYCQRHKIAFRQDAMNNDTRFKRVKIRKELLPMLAELNPKIVETLANTAGLLGSQVEMLVANQTILTKEPKIADLSQMESGELNLYLRRWLKDVRGNLRTVGRKHIAAIASLCSSNKSGNTIELPGGDTVIKKGGRLIFVIKVDKTDADNYN